MDLDRDVYTRSLILNLMWHAGWRDDLRLYVMVHENGVQKRAEETRRTPITVVEELQERALQEMELFAVAAGDNGVRSLF